MDVPTFYAVSPALLVLSTVSSPQRHCKKPWALSKVMMKWRKMDKYLTTNCHPDEDDLFKKIEKHNKNHQRPGDQRKEVQIIGGNVTRLQGAGLPTRTRLCFFFFLRFIEV
jgi:hypothetical protein